MLSQRIRRRKLWPAAARTALLASRRSAKWEREAEAKIASHFEAGTLLALRNRRHRDINQGPLCGAGHVSESTGAAIFYPSTWDRVDAGIETRHKMPCFGFARAAIAGCFSKAS
jgi:hypothetical protein